MEVRRKKMNAELPLCLIETNILPRVSAKTIGRCMCVCKQWKSFLSTPTFARTHLRHVTINDHKLLLLEGQPPAVTFRTVDTGSTTIRSNPNPNPKPDPSSIDYIIASLDGLVCLASRKSTGYKLAFWNPLTGAYKKLSTPGFNFSPRDPIGFFIDSSNDYKLVCLVYNGRGGAHIYSHRLDSWREIEFSVGPNYGRRWSPATFGGESIYFIVTSNTETYSWIICFDVKTETFRKIRFPLVPSDYCGSLVVLNGSLHLCVSYRVYNTNCKYLKQGDMWRMDGDDGWVKVSAYSEPLCNEFRRQRICTTSTANWVAVLDQESDSFDKMNMGDFTARYWCFCSPSLWSYRCSRMIYVETLVSPYP